MPKCKKSLKTEVCQGCFNSGKSLLPIKEHLSLYKKLMEDILGDEMKLKEIPLMCRGCRNILRSVQKFQERAREAYKSLIMTIDLGDKTIQDPNLPSLTHSSSQPDNLTEDAIELTFKDRTEIVNDEKVAQNEVKIEYEYVVGGIKQIKEEKNEFDDVKIEIDMGTESLTGEDFMDDNEETTVKEELTEMEMSNQVKSERNKGVRESKRKIIRKIDYKTFTKLCTTVLIDERERERCMEAVKHRAEYLNMSFKCDNCLLGYNKRQQYEKHMQIYHAESNTHACELCNARFSAKSSMMRHMKSHSYKYVCSFCDYEGLNKRLVFAHLARAHRIDYECWECGLRFHDKYKEFYNHYNSMHKRFICDYCGLQATLKKRLIRHIRVKHCEHICKYCGKRYVMYDSLKRHIGMRHTKQVSEESYCVECNMQFDNIMLYTRHLKTSVKHKLKVVYPCTECPNVYAKKKTMTNHYKYIHLQKTNYYCEKCSRYFLNGFRLRTHTATYHNNIRAPKNKICSYCGRGFETNRILDNHIRTHTGERPFACTHCTATFGRKSALVTHARAIHKVMMRYATKE